ncbi:anti-sigma factor [Flavobacterium azooxidireducens]|uniref:Anti-sigma factor n=1 Tax=Flavobacterium azooxidireducens TaxID=1871076 RepID=A0ABY4KDR8_9FLAO|nr:anti-sigma factor [Flavobacterium azooxidireducens]UPQ78859.1 anti-sigma factor [Flavobacterium azooxidireducens]
MSTQEYIESGILELYVYGKLNDSEIEEVVKMAKQHAEIKAEIIEIENAMVYLSGSVAPRLSGKNYEAIKQQIFGDTTKVVELKPETKRKANFSQYLGWAAAIVFLVGGGYLYQQVEGKKEAIANIEKEKGKLQEAVVDLELKNKANEEALALVRDPKNTIVPLAGQEVSPTSFAKVYWNQETQTVYVDGAGLPEPPEGYVYQVWALKLNPLTPLSIGLLDDFKGDNKRIFAVDNVVEAEAFGITLEPAGGSVSPTLEQLYTLGKV